MSALSRRFSMVPIFKSPLSASSTLPIFTRCSLLPMPSVRRTDIVAVGSPLIWLAMAVACLDALVST
eukprot:701006-Alexandrium_andersonii.AAC.1